jgi:hypothetical protein
MGAPRARRRRARATALLEWREPRSLSAGVRSLRRSLRDQFPTLSRYGPFFYLAWALLFTGFVLLERRLATMPPHALYWLSPGLLAWPLVWLVGFRLPAMLWRSRVVVSDRGFHASPLYLKNGGRFEQMESFWFEVDGRSNDPILCVRRRDDAVLEFTVPPSIAIEPLRQLIVSHGVRAALDEHRGTP